jgi:N-acetylmuramoyl-L-alanine amidase
MKGVFVGICIWVMVFVSIACGMCVNVLLTPKAVAGVDALAMRIVLDAGHGGIDGGVVGRTSGVKESDLNLAIVYQIKSRLEELGFEVVLTRKTEAGLYETATKGFKRRDMEKRKEIIQQVKPSLVLSIHQNYYPSKNTRGGQVFYRKGQEQSKQLALGLQKKLNELYLGVGGRARSAAMGDFFMLECCACPSVLIECGFLSNPTEEALLSSESWQKQLAEEIASGILGYFAEISA